jgi:hypothetical protein
MPFPAIRFSTAVLLCAFVSQALFAWQTKHVRPFWTVMPPVPTARALTAQSFGDAQFLYRWLVMDLQNFGDTGGRFTPLRDYDMNLVVEWLQALHTLDARAEHHVALAALYFSQTQNRSDLKPLVQFIMRVVDEDPPRRLQWAANALLLAQLRLKDPELAKAIADQVAKYDFPQMKPIAYQLPAVIYDKAGDPVRAAVLMERAKDKLRGRVPETEVQYMDSFIDVMRRRAAQAAPNP